MMPHRAFLIIALLAFATCTCPLATSAVRAAGKPVISNHESGSTVRYPVVLLRGTIDSAATSLERRNTATGNDPAFMDDTRVDPARVHDDSAGRGVIWGLASTTIGATLHEMGHSFGLPHCKDPLGIMTRGFDRFNRVFTLTEPSARTRLRGAEFTAEEEAYFAPISAAYLRWSRWFQPDHTRCRDDEPPALAHDEEKHCISVESRHGVRWIGFWVGGDVVAYKDYPQDEPPKSVTLTVAEIETLLGGESLSSVTTIADNGQSSKLDLPR